jgi:hypothetical protein
MTRIPLIRQVRTGLLVALSVLIGALGPGFGIASASARSHRHHHHHHHSNMSCIPQGGGDRDSDNFGGPSDGDGCL